MSERLIHIVKDEPKRLNPVIHVIEQTVFLTGEVVQLMEQFQKLIDAQASATQQTIHKPLQSIKEVQRAPEAPIVSQEQYTQLVAQIEQLQQTQQKSMHHIFKAIDMLDLIRMSAQQGNVDNEWVTQIAQSTDTYLQNLRELDIEEIPVLGQLLDGRTMISIGTMPVSSVPNGQKHEVCFVQERGFRQISTGNVLREAKVINLY